MSVNISGHTKLYGLLGSPVEHSISPIIHNEAFQLLGLDSVYLCFDVGTENLKTAVNGLKAIGISGFNLTMPDKNLMCELVDELSDAARLIGAVNTVVNHNGKLIGHNTDGHGYIESVKAEGYTIKDKEITVLGAGGAATSIIVQLALDGASKVNIFSRKGTYYDRALMLVDELNKHTSCQITLYDLMDDQMLKQCVQNSYLLVNGTSVGMSPGIDQCIIKDYSLFRPELIVSDIIYNPRETLLLKTAKLHGCNTFNGLNMLIYQGAKAFEIWTDQQMPISKIIQKVVNFL